MRAEGRPAAATALLLAALAATLPAAASVPRAPAAPRVAAASADDARLLAQAADRADAGDCAGVLALLDPLVAGAAPVASGTRFSAQLLRMPCLAATGRGKEVAPVLAELQARAPHHPLVRAFEIFIAADQGRFDAAADGLAAIADEGSPALQLMPSSLWRALAQRLTVAGDIARRDRTALALARAGWTPEDRPELAESLALQGIGTLLDSGETAQARALLARVQRPAALWDMAIQRRYAPLWPAIEARLGAASGVAADRFARTALAAFAAAPNEDRARLDAVRAFIALGRGADAERTAAPVAAVPGLGEDRLDMALDDATAKSARGAGQAAIDRVLPFARLDLARTPEATAAIIVLGELYEEAGDHAAALALARTTLARNGPFSAFGTAWLRRTEVCALAGLGEQAQAARAADAMRATAGDNQPAAVEAALCANQDDAAERLAIAALATRDGASRLAEQFQPQGAFFLHPPGRMRARWAALLARPAVRAAFDRVARILPERLWPAATPRALPAPPPPPADGLTST
ncbi:hypothetical protein [Sphingomonas morindae]|uniref:Tetratricopeptide repeat protein n=1 Tax=Sphingomonas morindae TaxID=1541170 RepID=A0ABY4X871_9SPHN|nr:hypothetical protein [Sphingomonas morindae]USI73069.1 hypothetical protein LHA26_00900 [Sphingomonas morindae]